MADVTAAGGLSLVADDGAVAGPAWSSASNRVLFGACSQGASAEADVSLRKTSSSFFNNSSGPGSLEDAEVCCCTGGRS